MPCQLLEEPWRRLAVKTRLPRPVPDPDERAVAPRRGSEFFSICFLPPARSPVPALRGCRPGLRGETGGRAGAGVTRGLRTPRWACRHMRTSSVIVRRRTRVSGRGPWNRDAPVGRSSSQRPWGSSQRPWGKAETKSHFPLMPAPASLAASAERGWGASAARLVLRAACLEPAGPCPHPRGRGAAVVDWSLLSRPGLGDGEAGGPRGQRGLRGRVGERAGSGGGRASVLATSEAAREAERTAPCTPR